MPSQPPVVIIMSMDLYTQNISLTQKARFWSNYISALKGKLSSSIYLSVPSPVTNTGQETLCAAGEGESRVWYPSVWETVPAEARDLKKEIGKIEDQMLSRKRQGTPLTPVIPQAHDQ